MLGLNKKKETFKFYVPISHEPFEKGSDDTSNGKYLMKIKGVASSKTEDTDGETLDPLGFSVKKGSLINWNHQASKTSSAICGKPTFTTVINNGQDFWVEGVIFNNAEGRAVAELIETLKGEDDVVLGWSIEGKVLEKNPLDPKKITKALLTGFALTHVPKNGNTWVDIVKGEYDELDPAEEEKDEDEFEKDMSTANTGILAPEHVEHKEAPKKGSVKNLVGLSKSQVYERIMDKYKLKDFVFINNIYNFVKSIKVDSMKDTTITPDTLEKAMAFLDAVAKGESTEGLAEGSTTTEPTTAAPEAEIAKSEDAEANTFAKSLVAEGKDKDQCIEEMIRKGHSYSTSLAAAETAIAEKPAAQNSNIDAAALSKSILDEISKSITDTIGSSVAPLNDKIAKGFGAVNELLKSQSEQNQLLKGELDKLTSRLEKVETTPLTAKSMRNVAGMEKFAKSEDGAAPHGLREVNINDRIEKGNILNELEMKFDTARNNQEKEIWGSAMRDVEAVGLAGLQPAVAKSLGIHLVAA